MLETTLQDWDLAYNQLIRWKIQLTQILIPKLLKNQYGRIVYTESTSINRPVKNLVLSNSLRMSIIGFVKTLVLEHGKSGITFNILAPGYHDTRALERLYKKLSVQDEITIDEAKLKLTSSIPVGEIGSVDDYASLASWLLSLKSSFVTGQVFTIDGGASI
jgi:3-oxoacyl-[acyl-carrier protein] reductase